MTNIYELLYPRIAKESIQEYFAFHDAKCTNISVVLRPLNQVAVIAEMHVTRKMVM